MRMWNKILTWLKRMQFAKLMCALLTASAIGLFVWGFFVPPLGVIDGSVLKAGGILLGFVVLWVLAHIVIELDKTGRARVGKDGLELEFKEEE